MHTQPSDQTNLLDELLVQASRIAQDVLTSPGSAARLRQLDSSSRSEIQRLEASPSALDQFVATAYRLAGSRQPRGDISIRLSAHFGNCPSSLEIEAQRRSIWKLNRAEPLPLTKAEVATEQIVGLLASQKRESAIHLPRWAALYADLWCDPRIGATVDARRIMLMMVTLLHERGVTAGVRAPAGQVAT